MSIHETKECFKLFKAIKLILSYGFVHQEYPLLFSLLFTFPKKNVEKNWTFFRNDRFLLYAYGLTQKNALFLSKKESYDHVYF